MSEATENIIIETDFFIFEAPHGYQIESLDEQAELAGPNNEFLVVSSYSIDDDSNDQTIKDFAQNIANAMREAANESDLSISGKFKTEMADNGLPISRLLAEATDKSHFFDQYAVVKKTTAVVVTIEGDFDDRSSSAHVEEAVHALSFK